MVARIESPVQATQNIEQKPFAYNPLGGAQKIKITNTNVQFCNVLAPKTPQVSDKVKIGIPFNELLRKFDINHPKWNTAAKLDRQNRNCQLILGKIAGKMCQLTSLPTAARGEALAQRNILLSSIAGLLKEYKTISDSMTTSFRLKQGEPTKLITDKLVGTLANSKNKEAMELLKDFCVLSKADIYDFGGAEETRDILQGIVTELDAALGKHNAPPKEPTKTFLERLFTTKTTELKQNISATASTLLHWRKGISALLKRLLKSLRASREILKPTPLWIFRKILTR